MKLLPHTRLRRVGGLVCACWSLLLVTTASAQAPQIAETLRNLRAIQTEEIPTTVPPEARTLLTELKHRLRDLITQVMDDPRVQDKTPAQIRAAVLEKLKGVGIEPKPIVPGVHPYDPQSDKYGYIEDIQIEQPNGHPNLLAAVTTLQIPCGYDSSLYILRKQNPGWKLILAQETNGYPEINGAQGAFQYALSPLDQRGSWFVVAAWVNPWCTSTWQSLRYRVLRPGPAPYEPTRSLHQHVGVWLGCDKGYKLTVRRGGFQVSQVASQSLDTGILTRVHVQNYAVTGDQVMRIPPLALLPQDFLDEWVGLPWEEAAQWTNLSKSDQMHEWHCRLRGSGPMLYYSEFDFVQACGKEKTPSRWQIGLRIDSKGRPTGLPNELFFTIIRKSGVFYLEDITTARPPGCPGEAYAVSTTGCPKLP